MRLIHTKKMDRYLINFVLRVMVLAAVIYFYIWDRDRIYELMNRPLYQGISLMHLLWFFFMCIMIRHLFPDDKRSMALLKGRQEKYVPVEDYSEVELLRFVQEQNVKAWRVMLIWMFLNAVIGILYLCKVIGVPELCIITVIFFVCDYICIIFFCPFMFVMNNRCCVNCRIYDWGHFMMFTPMLFIRNFFSWSFFTSLVVLIHWELVYASHPERFWSGSNKAIQCANCNDKTCQIKKKSMSGFARLF